MNTTPRARRVTMTVPVRYRPVGGEYWLEGRMLNVSESGVLFAPSLVGVGIRVEVTFSMPINIASLGAGTVFCVGEAVRVTSSNAAAVRFEECRFLLGDVT
jgi:hypothetical protein